MKKVFIQFVFCAISITSLFSQNYQALEWDLGLARLIPTTLDFNSAFGITTEARYNVTDILSVGIRYDRQFLDIGFDEPVRGLELTTSYGVTGDYYIWHDRDERVFFGLTIGSFNYSAQTEAGMEIGGRGFVLTPRIGYDFFLTRFIAEYTYTFDQNFPSYYSFGMSLNLGGKYKS